MREHIVGLTKDEVRQQTERGHVNKIPKGKTVSSWQIVVGHTFNVFNLYNVIIACFLVYVGEYLSILFLNVILMNIAIRSFQEIRAKKVVESLNILIAQDTYVLRDGKLEHIAGEDLVLGDVVKYRLGDQISADAVVIQDAVEMNESNLTGESKPVMKHTGDTLLSGSFVTSGTCYAKTIRVGLDSFAQKITSEASNYEPVASELMTTFLRITRWCTRIVLPIGIILVVQAMVFRGQDLRSTVLNTATVLLGLLPKGLVLLTSLSFGVSVFRLAQKRTLVQEIYSIEVLSKVDVLCIDKTGTLTVGEMSVQDVLYLEDQAFVDSVISDYLVNTKDSDSTTQSMLKHFTLTPSNPLVADIPFSSSRKWGAKQFEGKGTVLMGAPEFLIDNYQMPQEAIAYQNQGARVLLVGQSDEALVGMERPDTIKALALVIIFDPIRDEVYESLAFFKNNEVNVKVISGDNINTLKAVATKTGIVDGDKAIDVSHIETDEALRDAVMNYNVIGRATPYQKQKMVKMLQEASQKVAMVGDGVNDVLALRTADCSVAMGSGSGAARQAAQIILLDNEFTTMVDVVMEGRLVTNNISRSASMYYLGTLLTLLLSLVSIFMNTSYPFAPIQISIMSMFVEGMPSSFVTFESNYAKPKGRIIPNILKNILPNALTMALMFSIILTLDYPLPVLQTMIYYVTAFLSFSLVVKLFQPMNWRRIGVMLLSGTCLSVICYLFYRQLYLVHLDAPEKQLTAILMLCSAGVVLALHFVAQKVYASFEAKSNAR